MTKSPVDMFVIITLKNGLKLYKETGLKPNRDWTPGNMMKAAEHHTGKKFKPRDYAAAIQALEEVINAPQNP